MQKAYFISGLGVDSSVYQRISLPAGYAPVFTEWISPGNDESMASYTARLLKDVTVKKGDIFIGLSFGSLVCLEAAKKNEPGAVILISGFRDKRDLKFLPSLLLKLGLHRIIPEGGYKWLKGIAQHFFGGSSREGRILLRRMLAYTDYRFTRWAFEQIRRSESAPAEALNLHNIIGSRDPLISTWKCGNDHVVRGGNHFMVFERAEEVNRILHKILSRGEEI